MASKCDRCPEVNEKEVLFRSSLYATAANKQNEQNRNLFTKTMNTNKRKPIILRFFVSMINLIELNVANSYYNFMSNNSNKLVKTNVFFAFHISKNIQF